MAPAGTNIFYILYKNLPDNLTINGDFIFIELVQYGIVLISITACEHASIDAQHL